MDTDLREPIDLLPRERAVLAELINTIAAGEQARSHLGNLISVVVERSGAPDGQWGINKQLTQIIPLEVQDAATQRP